MQTITVPTGDHGTTIKSSNTGGDYFDYRIAATSSQVLKIDVTGESNVFFNVLPPNDDVAIHNSSDDFEATARKLCFNSNAEQLQHAFRTAHLPLIKF